MNPNDLGSKQVAPETVVEVRVSWERVAASPWAGCRLVSRVKSADGVEREVPSREALGLLAALRAAGARLDESVEGMGRVVRVTSDVRRATNGEKKARPATVEAAVEEMVALGKASKPELAGRLDSAAGLVLDGRVALVDGRTARVGPYRVEAGGCTCADFLYRGDWCKHRLAARMARHLVANGFELPLPRVEATTTPQVSAKNLALIASGKVIDDAIRERAAYSRSAHGARTAALRMLGNGAKTLPADLAMRAGVGGNKRYEKRDTSEEETR